MDYTSSSSNYSSCAGNYTSNSSTYSPETTLEHTTNYKLDPCCHRGCPGCPYK
ncbi:hypothetical protein HYY69_04845 [Candidatus Woesearchaeota archaeon]|nr:hypothetical protein [Candidatus Woesearchaeota archaeon]